MLPRVIRGFSGMLRDQVARSLMTMYVNQRGRQFNTLFPQGIKLPRLAGSTPGLMQTARRFPTIITLKEVCNIYATSCGSCINTCIGAQRLITEGSMSPDQISNRFTSAKDKVDYLKNQMKGEHLV